MPRPRPLIVLGLPIVLAWLVAMAAVVRGPRWAVPEPRPAQRLFGPESTQLALLLDTGDGRERPIGRAHVVRAPANRPGAEVGKGGTGDTIEGIQHRLDLRLDLEVLGRPADLTLRAEAWEPLESGPPTQLHLVVDSGEAQLELSGTLEDNTLRADLETAGATRHLEIPLGRGTAAANTLFSGGLTTVALPDLEVGEATRIATFDPLSLGFSEASVRCLRREPVPGDPTRQARLLTVEGGLLDARAWIDDNGDILRAETALGIVLQRVDGSVLEEAQDISGATPGRVAESSSPDDRAAVGAELLRRTAIEPHGLRPTRGLTRLTLRLLAPKGVSLVEDAYQRALELGAERRYTVLTSAAGAGFPDREVLDEDLQPDPLVQSDDPRIVARAQQIVTQANADAYSRALAIHDWVFESIEKVPMFSVPSAVEVLEQRRGDCNEHTVLYTALARAAGLPTRIAIGIVWSDAYGGFYYHAWPEVWLGERWHRFDPTLGQTEADATHIKLLEGSIGAWPRLLTYLGKLEIEVEETSP